MEDSKLINRRRHKNRVYAFNRKILEAQTLEQTPLIENHINKLTTEHNNYLEKRKQAIKRVEEKNNINIPIEEALDEIIVLMEDKKEKDYETLTKCIYVCLKHYSSSQRLSPEL